MSKKIIATVAFFIGIGTMIIGLTLIAAILINGITQKSTFIVDEEWVVLVNKYREQNSIPPVKEDYFLNTLAAAKCNDMVERNYYSHYDPDGKRIDALAMKLYSFDLNKEAWAENIHKGAIYTSSKTMLDWYNSPEHRKAMLDPVYTRVGHAQCYSGSSYTMVEVFTDEY